MKNFLLLAVGLFFTINNAIAIDVGSCEAKAVEKKLKGAAKTNFMKKCEKDASVTVVATPSTACTSKADEKKLKGAARNSFMKKCEKDAVSK